MKFAIFNYIKFKILLIFDFQHYKFAYNRKYSHNNP